MTDILADLDQLDLQTNTQNSSMLNFDYNKDSDIVNAWTTAIHTLSSDPGTTANDCDVSEDEVNPIDILQFGQRQLAIGSWPRPVGEPQVGLFACYLAS